jgi:hypothetical protein
MPRSGITRSYDSSIFSLLGTLHNAFHSGCTNLHSHQQCIRVSVLLYPRKHLLLLFPLNYGHSNWGEVKSECSLICISLLTREVEHFFYVFTNYLYLSFENSLFNFCAHFFIGMLIFWEVEFF